MTSPAPPPPLIALVKPPRPPAPTTNISHSVLLLNVIVPLLIKVIYAKLLNKFVNVPLVKLGNGADGVNESDFIFKLLLSKSKKLEL